MPNYRRRNIRRQARKEWEAFMRPSEEQRVSKLMEQENMVFVFGSNLQGVHGAGAALTAVRQYGAVLGEEGGHHGRSYAIPTKVLPTDSFSISPRQIALMVGRFLFYAESHPELEFAVTRVGCGFARLTDSVMAPMFKGAPGNVHLPPLWHSLNGQSE